jgi:adenylate cyclase
MSSKSENLVVVLTDIVGFTKATAAQSRSENEELIRTHNALLLPIVSKFGGRHVKSIGDALLLVFDSPTDALLCSMALQDRLHAFNIEAPEGKEIHIRIAVNLGEVRTSRKDVLGDPVNVTSRIEAVTPGDEIYFSEAVYMTMNKAEIPSQEIGWKELAGVSEKVRIYCIPRFANTKLVTSPSNTNEDISDVAYPFGGAHLREPYSAIKLKSRNRSLFVGAVLLILALIAVFSFWQPQSEKHSTSTAAPDSETEEAQQIETSSASSSESAAASAGNQKQPQFPHRPPRHFRPPLGQNQMRPGAPRPNIPSGQFGRRPPPGGQGDRNFRPGMRK